MENLPKRKPLRLGDYDYSTPGVYFITICTYNRKNTLSRIVGAIHESPVTQLTSTSVIVDRIIRSLPPHLQTTVDHYVIMPNHVHLLLRIEEFDTDRAIHESPLRSRSAISKTVGYIKMNASKQIRANFGTQEVWQRGYYDHIIRNQADYNKIATYICENPLRWTLDKLYNED